MSLDGSIPSECLVCGYRTILRFNVCKECDDAFWLTRMSKKHHRGAENHSIYDVKYIRKQMKLRLDKILELDQQNKQLREENKKLKECAVELLNNYIKCPQNEHNPPIVEWRYIYNLRGLLKEIGGSDE